MLLTCLNVDRFLQGVDSTQESPLFFFSQAMACAECGCHGCKIGEDLFRFTEANWKVVSNDIEYYGWIESWNEVVGLPAGWDTFLRDLLTWPEGPIIWLDTPERALAPIFIVAHYGKNIHRRNYMFQFGCWYGGKHQTQPLYPCSVLAHERHHASRTLQRFFYPLWRLWCIRQGLKYEPRTSLTVSNLALHTVASHFAASSAMQPPPPPPPPPPRLSMHVASVEPSPSRCPEGTWSPYVCPTSSAVWWFNDLTEVFFYKQTGTSSLLPWSPSPEGRWIQYVYNNALWWQNDVTKKFFFESTGTRNVPVKALGNCCISTAVGGSDATTTAGDNAATPVDATTADATTADATTADDGALCSSVTQERYVGLCVYRAYEKNLYYPGQPPPVGASVEC